MTIKKQRKSSAPLTATTKTARTKTALTALNERVKKTAAEAKKTFPAVDAAKHVHTIDDFYKPFPRQREFHDSTAKYRLFGGAAGPGKTKALLYEAILQAHKHPGVDTLLLRRTFAELEASLLTYFRRDVPRES